jgi:TolA-binding protein
MGTKVKITKRDIKEDKFTTSMLLAKDWLSERWQIVAIAAVVVIVVIVAIVYFSNLQKERAQLGSEQLSQAVLKMRQMNYQEAIIDFARIADEFGGGVASRAQFYLANAHYDSRNYEEAITNYQKYLDKYGNDDPLTSSSAIAGVAACMENQQQYLAAGDKYLEAIAFYPKTATAADYYLGSVRCYVLAGDSARAEQALSELNDKFPRSEQSLSAIRLIMSVRI